MVAHRLNTLDNCNKIYQAGGGNVRGSICNLRLRQETGILFMVNKTWENIWNNRPMSSEVSLETAIKLSGFDAGLGAESPASWLHYTHNIVKLLGIKKGETVIEYGCGAGSLLEGLRQHVHCNVMGVDYSHKLLSYARQLVVGEFIHSNITNFESEKMFTYSLSNSVFQYLSENDAKKVMNSAIKRRKENCHI